MKKFKNYTIKENLSEKELLRLIALQNKAILTQLALVEGNAVTATFRNTYYEEHLDDIEYYLGADKVKPWTYERGITEIGHQKLVLLCNMRKRRDDGMDEKELNEKLKEFDILEFKEVLDFDWVANYND